MPSELLDTLEVTTYVPASKSQGDPGDSEDALQDALQVTAVVRAAPLAGEDAGAEVMSEAVQWASNSKDEMGPVGNALEVVELIMTGCEDDASKATDQEQVVPGTDALMKADGTISPRQCAGSEPPAESESEAAPEPIQRAPVSEARAGDVPTQPRGIQAGGGSEEECVVCSEDLVEGDRVIWLPCHHCFHERYVSLCVYVCACKFHANSLTTMVTSICSSCLALSMSLEPCWQYQRPPESTVQHFQTPHHNITVQQSKAKQESNSAETLPPLPQVYPPMA